MQISVYAAKTQLSSLLEAGLPLFTTLEQLSKHPPAASLRAPALLLLAGLQQGQTFTESFRGLAGWAPEFDIALIQAGEHSAERDAEDHRHADPCR